MSSSPAVLSEDCSEGCKGKGEQQLQPDLECIPEHLRIDLSDQFPPSRNNLGELLLKCRSAEIVPLNLSGKRFPAMPVF
jgi:hypothetical protein